MKSNNKIVAFFSTLAVLGLWSSTAFAQDGGAAANAFSMFSWLGMAAGLGIGLAVIGGALGQGRAAAAAMEGIARNPKSRDEVFVPLILGLAFIESLVIYALVITYFVQSHIGISGTLSVAGG
jgi:F-type H+-transporting ATPase subunit c